MLKCWIWSCSSVRISYPDTSIFSKLNVMDMNWGLTWILNQCQYESSTWLIYINRRYAKIDLSQTFVFNLNKKWWTKSTDWAYKKSHCLLINKNYISAGWLEIGLVQAVDCNILFDCRCHFLFANSWYGSYHMNSLIWDSFWCNKWLCM